jgi:type II secretory pathway pseudopilin PulG
MKRHKFLSSSGFSMVEISVAMGLLGLATLAVMNLTDNVTTASRRAETLLNKSQFASALGSYMYSSSACGEVQGMGAFDATPKPIVLNNWKVAGHDENNGIPEMIKGIGSGKKFKNFELKKLEATMDTTTGTLGKVTINGGVYTKTFLNVLAQIEVSQGSKKDDPDPTKGKRQYDYFFNIPVLADAGGVVKYCAEEKGLRETCASMSGTFDETTKKCKMDDTCSIQGTYRVLSCDYSACDTGSEGASEGNPVYSNNLACPGSSTRIQTGYKSWTSQAPCSGKKCTPIDVHNTMNWFSCLKCPTGSTSGGSSAGGAIGGGGGGGYSGGGGGGCFVAGTQIHMFGGEKKNIEDILVGDELSDFKGNNVKVVSLMRIPYSGKIYSINGGGFFFTPNHPFLTINGWKSLDPKTSMKDAPGLLVTQLKVGDTLLKKKGHEVIKTLEFKVVKETVYNFEVSGSHEYIADDYAVHNKQEIMQEAFQ